MDFPADEQTTPKGRTPDAAAPADRLVVPQQAVGDDEVAPPAADGVDRDPSTAGLPAATDVTGFSLVGHAYEMAERSGVAIRIRASDVGFLLDLARIGRGVLLAPSFVLEESLATDPRNRNFALPTGHIHTADELLRRLDYLLVL